MFQQAYGVDLMDIAAGGFLDSGTQNWIQERTNALMSTVSATTANWFNKAKSFYQTITESDAIQALRNLTAKEDVCWKGNNIYLCNSIEQIQATNIVQQRYIMAEPRLRQMYLNQEVEGFAATYNNVQGEAIGMKQFDYRRVTDGMLLVTEDSMQWTDYHENLPEQERELELYERADMIRNWNLVNICLDKAEQDPSSPIGNML